MADDPVTDNKPSEKAAPAPVVAPVLEPVKAVVPPSPVAQPSAPADSPADSPVDDPVVERKTLFGGGFHPELPGVTLGEGAVEIERLASMTPGVWRVADAELRAVVEQGRSLVDELRRAFDHRLGDPA